MYLEYPLQRHIHNLVPYIGSNGYKGGWRISYYDMMPLDHQYRSTQSMDIKEEGCRAFADALKKCGIEAYMESRAD